MSLTALFVLLLHTAKMIPVATLSTYFPINWESFRWVSGSTVFACACLTMFWLIICLVCFSDHMAKEHGMIRVAAAYLSVIQTATDMPTLREFHSHSVNSTDMNLG